MRTLLVLALLGITFALGSAARPTATPPPPKAPAEVTKARLNSARRVFADHLELYRAGVCLDGERVYLWSRRWLDAQREQAVTPADQAAAFAAHRDRMKLLHEVTTKHHKGGTVAPTAVAAAEFYRAEAELWLEQAPGR